MPLHPLHSSQTMTRQSSLLIFLSLHLVLLLCTVHQGIYVVSADVHIHTQPYYDADGTRARGGKNSGGVTPGEKKSNSGKRKRKKKTKAKEKEADTENDDDYDGGWWWWKESKNNDGAGSASQNECDDANNDLPIIVSGWRARRVKCYFHTKSLILLNVEGEPSQYRDLFEMVEEEEAEEEFEEMKAEEINKRRRRWRIAQDEKKDTDEEEDDRHDDEIVGRKKRKRNTRVSIAREGSKYNQRITYPSIMPKSGVLVQLSDFCEDEDEKACNLELVHGYKKKNNSNVLLFKMLLHYDSRGANWWCTRTHCRPTI